MKRPTNPLLKPDDAKATALQLLPYNPGETFGVSYARAELVSKKAECVPSEAGSIDVLLSIRIRFSPLHE